MYHRARKEEKEGKKNPGQGPVINKGRILSDTIKSFLLKSLPRPYLTIGFVPEKRLGGGGKVLHRNEYERTKI